jgi:alcohol dehydrogenase
VTASFAFHAPTRIISSEDCARSLSDVLASEACASIAIVVDRNVVAAAAVQDCLRACEKVSGRVTVSVVDAREPDTDFVDEQVARLGHDRPDLLVGIGGGSVLDLGKAVAGLLANPGPAADYQGRNLLRNPACPTVMMPTTAGTGSEVTPGAVVFNRAIKRKGAIWSPYLVPRYAILDPALTAGMPGRVAASTGMDALAHAVESFAARSATPMTRMYSREGFRLIARSLGTIVREGGDDRLRRDQQLGATLAGIAICNSDTGACHAMAYALGIYFGVPHAVAIALLLPRVLARNIMKGATQYAPLWDEVPGMTAGSMPSDEARCRALQAFIAELVPAEALGVSLADYGVRATDVAELAERSLDLKTALGNNPVDFDGQDAADVLHGALHA